MSRFGSTALIQWNEGDAFDTDDHELISFFEEDMPQYPFEESRVTDSTEHRSLSGKVYKYQNYNKVVYTFSWTNLSEARKEELTTMADSLPKFSFKSGTTTFGTFRMVENSYSASETTFELYDVSFQAEAV